MSEDAVIVSAESLKHFAHEIFLRAGMSGEHAGVTAEVLVWADLRGVDSHGLNLLPHYVRQVRAGNISLASNVIT